MACIEASGEASQRWRRSVVKASRSHHGKANEVQGLFTQEHQARNRAQRGLGLH